MPTSALMPFFPWHGGLTESHREPGISRGTFAVFNQPPFDEVLEVPTERRPDQVYSRNFWPGSIDYMKHAPTIQSRWSNGKTFGEFAIKSLQTYHG